MQIDTDSLDELDLTTLQDAKRKIDRAIASWQARKERGFIDRVTALAKSEGVDVSKIVAQLTKKPAKGNAVAGKPKYRHRSDATKTWTGKGRRPEWMAEFGEEVSSQ